MTRAPEHDREPAPGADAAAAEDAAMEAEVLAGVARSGFQIMHVAGDEPGEEDFAYTIGLGASMAHADLIVFGIPWPGASTLLGRAIALVREGRRLAPGASIGALVAGGPVVLVPVPPDEREEHLTWTSWFYGREPFEALQLVWPDPLGRHPWEPGYRAARQPLLREAGR